MAIQQVESKTSLFTRPKPYNTIERFVFASADIWGGGGQTLVAVLYLVYLTNILGVSPGVAGTALLIAKIWDAVIDPFLGVIGDNTRTRWGRRRPYLIFGGLFLLITMAIFWLPVKMASPLAQGAMIVFSNILAATLSSMLAIAYSAMSTEISTDFDQLNKLNITRLIFSMSATAVCTLLPTIFFKKLTSGEINVTTFYFIVVLGFGLVFALPIVFAGLYCRERAPYEDEKIKISPLGLIEPLKVKVFRQQVGLYLSQTVTMDTVSAIIIYYSLYVIKGLNTTIFLGIFLAIQLIMLPIFNQLVKTTSKTHLFRFGLPFAIVGALAIGLYPSTWPVIGVYILTAITALGYAGTMTLSWIIFPDIVDIAELVEGKRSTGAFSATMSFIRQISSAITIFIIGNMLSLTGFITPSEAMPNPEQPSATVWAIRMIFVLAFVILGANAWHIAGKLQLSPEKSKRIKYFLAKRALIKKEDYLNDENIYADKIATNTWTKEELREMDTYIEYYK